MELSNGVKLSKEERVDIADRCIRMIDASWDAIEPLNERWKRIEELYRLEPYKRVYAVGSDDEASEFCFPLVAEKLDGIAAQMTTIIFEGDPVFIYKVSGDAAKEADVVEQTVQFLLKQADYERYVKLHVLLTAMTGRAAYRCSFAVRPKGFHADQESTAGIRPSELNSDGVAYCGINLEVFHPRDMVIYPMSISEPVRATLIGHRFYLLKSEIAEKQAAGIYLKDEEKFSSDSVTEQEAGRSSSFDLLDKEATADDEDESVKCFAVIVKLDLNKDGISEFYQVDLAYNQRAILSIEPFEYDRPWYYAPTLTVEYNTFFYTNSIGQRLQGLNLIKNELLGILYDGTMARSNPTTFVNNDGGRITDEYLDAKPGRIYPVEGEPRIASVPSQFDPSTIPTMLQYVDSEAESVARVSRTTSAQPYRSRTTATEVSAIQQAQAVSGNDYLMTYAGSEFCALADCVRQFAYINFDLLKIVYGDAFPADSKEQLAGGGVWDVSARYPSRTPMGRLAAAQNLLAVWAQTQSPRIDVDQLIHGMVMDSGLPNKDQVYRDDDEVAAFLGGFNMGPGSGAGELEGMGGPQGLLAEGGGAIQDPANGALPLEGF